VLVPSAALLWGLQFAFLNPALALLLVALFHATTGQVGGVLAVYNASGFVASLLLPAYADRRGDYLRPMLGCGVLTLALAVALALSSSLPVAVVGLLVLGGPAGVGSSLLFAHLRHSGASRADVVNTRAVVSFAWVAGPPVAAFVMGSLGSRSILPVLAVVALLNILTTVAMLRQGRRPTGQRAGRAVEEPGAPMPRSGVVVIVGAFILLQAGNNAVVAVMSLFVTRTLGLPLVWAGAALGLAAALEIPVLLLIGRLSARFSDLQLIVPGCVAGIAYYVAMAYVAGPVSLLLLQVLNAWFFATVAGVGLALFQRVIPRHGLASGLYTNTRRLGAIVSGPVIAVGSATSLGYGAVFAVCAALTGAGLVGIGLAARLARGEGSAQARGSSPESAASRWSPTISA